MPHPRQILNNDELKPITVVCEFILEEGALERRANCVTHRVPSFWVLLHNPSGETTICACDEDLGWGKMATMKEGTQRTDKNSIASVLENPLDCMISSRFSFCRTSGILVSAPLGFNL